MNFPDYCSATGNSKRSMFVMSTASSSGSGSGRSNDDPNHNLYSNHVTKHDPFSFLEEEDNDDCDGSLSLLLKPLRDPPISLDDLDDFINSSEISDAIVPTSALAPVASGGVPFSPITISGSMFTQIPVQQQQLRQTLVQMQPIQDNHDEEQDRRTNAASAAATSALLKSWMVPQELIVESTNGFAMVLDPSGTIEYVSDTVRCHVGHPGQLMRGQSIYTYVLQADQEKISVALHPNNLISPQNADNVSGITANVDPLYRRTFAVRFLIGNHSKNVGEGFERLFISSVPLRRASKTTPSLLCIARKIGTTPATLIQSQQGQSTTLYLQQTSSVLPGPLNQQDLFSTRLDPASFRIIFTETDKVSLSARVSGMFGKSFLEFCPQEDQEIIRNHFLETLQSTSDVSYTISKPYSITGLFGSVTDPQQQRSIRVQTRSKYIKSNNHQEKGYIASTHSVFRGAGLSTGSTQNYSPTPMSNSNLSVVGTKPLTIIKDAGITQTRPLRKPRSPPLSPPSESHQKNLLLKQLLNTTYSCADEYPFREQSPSTSNARILKILNQPENLPRLKRGGEGSKSVSPQPTTALDSSFLSTTKQRMKRSASGSFIDEEPFPKTLASSLDSLVCRENPSLVNLLVKPLPIAVPPPVPTKWHQEPKEKLPKDTMRKFLPPHPADRASFSSGSKFSPTNNLAQIKGVGSKSLEHTIKSEPNVDSLNIPKFETTELLLQTVKPNSASAFHHSQTLTNYTQPPSPLLDISLNDNDLLSEILDGLIDFQEKSPVGRVMQPLESQASAATPFQPECQISTIEKYLASTEKTVLQQNQSTFQAKASVPEGNATLSSLLSSPPISSIPMRHLSGNNMLMTLAQPQSPNQSRQAAASMVPRMSELLQVVPPNVSVADAPQGSLESILMQERCRRLSSGNVVSFQQPEAIRSVRHQNLPYTEVVDPREVIPSAAFPARPPVRPGQTQHFVSVRSPLGLQASPQPQFSGISTSFQTFSGGSVVINQQPSVQMQHQVQQKSPTIFVQPNFVGQSQQTQIQNRTLQPNGLMAGHSPTLTGSIQLPPLIMGGNNIIQDNRPPTDEKRSLLQKLLSE